jgi:hypothetical protein
MQIRISISDLHTIFRKASCQATENARFASAWAGGEGAVASPPVACWIADAEDSRADKKKTADPWKNRRF